MANVAYGTKLQRRGKHQWYYFLFTVPKASYGKIKKTKSGKPKKQIWVSLGTIDRDEALMRMGPKLADLKQQFPAGINDNRPATYATISDTSRSLGFEYRPAPEVRQPSVAETVEIVNKLIEARMRFDTPDANQVIAITGAMPIPELTLETALERYKIIKADKVLNKNEIQTDTYWAPYNRAVKDFTNFAGEIDVYNVKLQTIEDYRADLIQRVAKGDFKTDYANGYLERITRISKQFYKTRPNLRNPFPDVDLLTQNDDASREPFTDDEVRALAKKIKTSKANRELLAILQIAQNTGAGITELCWIHADDIILDAEIPHIKIRPNVYRKYLKEQVRERDLPLIGVALEAAKQFPKGFPRYQDQKGARRMYSATNRFIKSVVKNNSFAGYRHRIAELLRNGDYKDQFQNAVLGHKTAGMTGWYGGKVWLQNMKKALEAVLPEDTI